MPRCVAAEGDAEGEVLCYLWAGWCVEDVRFEVVDEMRGIGCGAVVAAEHVLCVPRVAVAPGAVVEVVDLSGAVVALVKGYGDEAIACLVAGVVGGDDLGGGWGHRFFGLEARVEEPEAGD